MSLVYSMNTGKPVLNHKEKAMATWDSAIIYLQENTQDRYRLAYILLEKASSLINDPSGQYSDDLVKSNLFEAKKIFKELGATLDFQKTVHLPRSP